ncbi:MAG: SulP family inorganic anion transporter [Flavobacteriales bacterium AspAUS03]
MVISITDLKDFDVFLCAVLITGLFQFLLGILLEEFISSYIYSNMIEGILLTIGIIILMKQIPYLVAFDLKDAVEFMLLKSGIVSITHAFNYIKLGIFIIGLVFLAILIVLEQPFIKKLNTIPAALVIVIVGVLINKLFL